MATLAATPYNGHNRDARISVLISESPGVIAGVYFGQTFVTYFCLGFSCCPSAVRIIGVSVIAG